VWYDSFVRVTWLIHMCTHLHMWPDNKVLASNISSVHVPWIINTCEKTQLYTCHDSFVCATRLIHMCGMSHSCVRHTLFLWRDSKFQISTHISLASWLISISDTTHSYVRHDSFIFYTSLFHICSRSYLFTSNWPAYYTSTDNQMPLICASWLISIFEVTHSYVRHDTFIR